MGFYQGYEFMKGHICHICISIRVKTEKSAYYCSGKFINCFGHSIVVGNRLADACE